ncbi:hypothetical protein [Pedobacter panaciterrae]
MKSPSQALNRLSMQEKKIESNELFPERSFIIVMIYVLLFKN